MHRQTITHAKTHPPEEEGKEDKLYVYAKFHARLGTWLTTVFDRNTRKAISPSALWTRRNNVQIVGTFSYYFALREEEKRGKISLLHRAVCSPFYRCVFCVSFSNRCISRSHWLTAYGDLFLHIERIQRAVRCQIPTEGFLQAEPINSLCYLFMKSDCYVLFFSCLFFFSFLASDIYAGIVWGILRVGKERSLCLRLLRVLPQRHGLSSFIQCPRIPRFCIPQTHSFRPPLSGISYTTLPPPPSPPSAVFFSFYA